MHRAGEWVRPTLQGEPWLEKTPLFYWLAGGAFAVLGETEAAARVPSVLAALLLVGATALFGARLYGSAAGLHAGFVAGTSLLPFAYARAASMDMLLAATVTVAIGLRRPAPARDRGPPRDRGRGGRRRRRDAGQGAARPPAADPGPRRVRRGHARVALRPRAPRPAGASPRSWSWPPPGTSRSCATRAATSSTSSSSNHNVERFTSTVHNHPGPFWYYLPVLLAGLFPWSGLAVPALFRSAPRASRKDLLVLLWLSLPLVFFSLAGSKLPGYILPCVPPLAILMGRAADRLITEPETPERMRSSRAVALVGLVLAALVAAAPAALWRIQEPLWRSAVPLGVWAVVVAFLFSRRVGADPAGAFRLLRIGAAGLLVLLALAAPAILARRESGQRLFVPAMGRDVLAWGAWRTAWMAGYFYNDGKVRAVEEASEILAAIDEGPTLVLAGPSERRRLEAMGSLEVHTLARGPRENALLRVEQRRAARACEGSEGAPARWPRRGLPGTRPRRRSVPAAPRRWLDRSPGRPTLVAGWTELLRRLASPCGPRCRPSPGTSG